MTPSSRSVPAASKSVELWVAGCHVRFGGNGEVRKRAAVSLYDAAFLPIQAWMQAGTISQRFAQSLVEEWPAVAVYLGEESEGARREWGYQLWGRPVRRQRRERDQVGCGKHDGEGDREKPGRPDSPSSGDLQGTTGLLDPVTHRIQEGPGEPDVMNR